MARAAFASELPSEYELVREARGVLAVHRDYADRLRELGLGPVRDPAWRPAGVEGRRPLVELELAGERLLWRRFRHGGLFRWLARERFLEPSRPFRELCLSAALRVHGIDTPLVVAARARRASSFSWLGGWQLALLTRREPDTVDGAALFWAGEASDVPRGAPRFALLHAFGELVGRLHRVGFLHADLTPKNVLVNQSAFDGQPARFWILDLDRSEFRDALDDETRCANLRRLLRFVERRRELGPDVLSASDVRRFLEGYSRGLARSGYDWRADWQRVQAQGRRRRWVHRIGWFLEERLGGGPARRAGDATP